MSAAPAGQSFERIAFVASEHDEASAAASALRERYGDTDVADADVVVALGGDGLMLQTLRAMLRSGMPIYGMHRGSVGFLMNEFSLDGLRERLAAAEVSEIRPLRMKATSADGETDVRLAINEVSLFRQIHQAAKLRIAVDGKVRMDELICDGVLVATPAGSTAYNLSAHGPILPIESPLLAITPISPFRPRRWRGALVSNRTHVAVTVLEADKRPVSAVADHDETRSVVHVEIAEADDIELRIMFDPDQSLSERIIAEQFKY